MGGNGTVTESIIPALLIFRSDSEMSGRDFEETVKEEEARLRVVHSTAEDVPGCMTLLDDFLSCNSGCLSRALSDTSITHRTHFQS